VAAFYRLPRYLFYILGGFHWGRFTIVFVGLPVRSEVKKIVHRMSEILFAAEIAFRRLHGYVPQQELNLLKLSAVRVAQLRTGSPQVMRRNMLQASSLAAGFDDVPHHILRDAFPHTFPALATARKILPSDRIGTTAQSDWAVQASH